MDLLRESQIDPAPLANKRVAIVGYGNQGRAQALNLKDSGIDLVVGLRDGSGSRIGAEAAGLQVDVLDRAVRSADVVMLLAPDEILGDLYLNLEPSLQSGIALGFSHGLAVHFGFISPREDLDVFLVAPKGPGTALRSLYEGGKGMIALWAVEQDATGRARDIALAYGRALGCARAGLISSSFEEEAVADLFNESAVVWGGVPELLRAGFETLVEAGISPEVAYLECVGELKLLADLIETHGIAGMREAISSTAELGAVLGGPKIIASDIRDRMKEALQSIRSGEFTQALRQEQEKGYPRLTRARSVAANQPTEHVYRQLKDVTG